MPKPRDAVEGVYAVTIHESQESQFDLAAVVLSDPSSRIVPRELVCTAARELAGLGRRGTVDRVRIALSKPIARTSGLRWCLWEG